MRLAGLLGLSSGDETDRVRALVAKAALARGDGGAACDILSAAISRRPPRLTAAGGGGGGGGGDGGGAGREEQQPFAPELCEVLDLVVEWGSRSERGGAGAVGAPARTADLCAQALSRCPASQIGRLLGPWSRFEAVRYVAGVSAAGGGGGGVSAASGGGGGTAAVASALVEGGMDENSATSLGRALAAGGLGGLPEDADEAGRSSWLDRHLAGDGGEALGGMMGGGGPGRAAEGALRFLLLREHGMSSPSSSPAPTAGVAAEIKGQVFATTKPHGRHADPAAATAAAAAAGGGDSDSTLQKATNRLCILLALAELRSFETDEPRAVANQAPSDADLGGSAPVSVADGEAGAPAAESKASEDATGRLGREGTAEEMAAAAAGGAGPAMPAMLARGAAEEFGVGAVERGVGYALAASDGRAVLDALRALLEEAEGMVKVLRDAAVEKGRSEGGSATTGAGRPGPAREADGEV